jgi:hypothetical protein
MHIGVSGHRNPLTRDEFYALEAYLEEHRDGDHVLHHGDCVGVDARAHEIAREFGYSIVVHPPYSDTYRALCFGSRVEVRPRREYLDRNRDIANECDVLIAIPSSKTEEVRSGTWATIRYARQAGKEVTIL